MSAFAEQGVPQEGLAPHCCVLIDNVACLASSRGSASFERPALIDRPVAVRPGETLDVARLGPFLQNALNLEGEVEVLQYPSGFSNLTYMLRVGDTEIVLRRPPFGSKPKSGHDMKREHDVLAALHGSFPYCPKPLVFWMTSRSSAAPSTSWRQIEGIIVRRDFPPGLSLSPDDVRALFDRVVDVHVELHSVDYRAVGLEDFGKPEGYVERQVAGWSDRYRRARTPDVPDCEGIMAWLEENRPPDSGPGCIVHNDFRLDNVVLDPNGPHAHRRRPRLGNGHPRRSVDGSRCVPRVLGGAG